MSDPTPRAIRVDDKDVGESDDLIFRVVELRSGESFSAADVVITIEPRYGDDANAAAMLVGPLEVGTYKDAPAIYQRLQGGVAGVVYLIRCLVTLSSGRKLVAAMLLRVRRLV